MGPADLPGSRHCVGCGGLTFRNREDGLCPRCAFEAEQLIEQIELECLDHDLALITRFEAYCRQRDMGDEEQPVFGRPLWNADRRDLPFERRGPFEGQFGRSQSA